MKKVFSDLPVAVCNTINSTNIIQALSRERGFGILGQILCDRCMECFMFKTDL